MGVVPEFVLGISIHALREEGDLPTTFPHLDLRISIHALREEGDERASRPRCGCPNFYPRPPRGGRRFTRTRESAGLTFLSTPSARRATPRGPAAEPLPQISIHALREEGDILAVDPIYGFIISIHALREEGDCLRTDDTRPQMDFYPRPPRGGRPSGVNWPLVTMSFLSTPSARRATYVAVLLVQFHAISIHALREEGDGSAGPLFGRGLPISIHALREEGDSPSGA